MSERSVHANFGAVHVSFVLGVWGMHAHGLRMTFKNAPFFHATHAHSTPPPRVSTPFAKSLRCMSISDGKYGECMRVACMLLVKVAESLVCVCLCCVCVCVCSVLFDLEKFMGRAFRPKYQMSPINVGLIILCCKSSLQVAASSSSRLHW